MNRHMLSRLLSQHASIQIPDDSVVPWKCLCGHRFVSERNWADHVTNVIYPET